MASSAAPACDVLVIAADVAGLLAAIDCARIGLRVDVRLTPDPSSATVFTNRDGVIAAACEELSVPYELSAPVEGEYVLAGIPGNPFSTYVRSRGGWGGAWRVYLDRVKPVLTIGNETNFGRLVRQRLGDRMAELLVQPAITELYQREIDDLLVDQIAPGLAQAMTRGGSLTTGVLEMVAADPRVAQTITPVGGVDALREAALTSLRYWGATVSETTGSKLEKGLGALVASANAVLCDPRLVELPAKVAAGRVAFVGITREYPGLESAIPASRDAAAGIRRVLLSDPENPPIGPVEFDH